MTQTLATVVGHVREALATSEGAGRSDRELLEEFTARQDSAAFTAIVRRYGPMVLGVSRRVLGHEHDAEDAFQATFLVLARRAGTVRRGESLAAWLYGTAYRTALRAKRDAARERAREGRAQPPARPDPFDELSWREVQQALDEEVGALPASYRGPFVLCCLEGASHAEAARRLGLKESAVSSRVTRARQRLRERLSRRGIELSALTAALAVASASRAAVPPALARATARAAALYAAGGLSAKGLVLTLAEGMTQTMFATKTRLATVLLLALAVAAAGVKLLGDRTATADEPKPAEKKATTGPAPGAEKKPTGETFTVRGRVLGPDGKPVEKARVYLLDQSARARAPEPRAASGADGGFHFTFQKSEIELGLGYVNPWLGVYLVAMAEGYGPAVGRLDRPDVPGEQTLRLAKDDVPIEGRVLDLEGRPVAGATVVVQGRLRAPKGDDLAALVRAVEADGSAFPAENNLLNAVYAPGLGRLFPEATTARDGRFTLKGIGRERVIGLTISGPAIETRDVQVMTRPGKTIVVPAWKNNPDGDKVTYHGARFDHVAAPSAPIVGVVKDADTGKPIAGAVVESYQLAGSNLSGSTRFRAVADAEGRFRLAGMPRGEGNVIRARPPEGQPYVMAVKRVPTGDGHKPATVDVSLKRGVWITGKAVDKVTGKPVHGTVEYFALAVNPHVVDYRGFTTDHHLRNRTGDGTFRLVGLPGPGMIAFRALGDGYLIGAGADRLSVKPQRNHYPTRPYLCLATGYHAFVEVNPARDAGSVECNVILDPGRTATGTVLGPDGKPLAGARVSGVKSYSYTYWEHEPLPSAEFTALGLHPGRPRQLLFLHEGKNLAGSVVVRGDENRPLSVKLQPAGTITGRLLNDAGRPRVGATLRFLRGVGRAVDGTGVGSHPHVDFRTGKDGAFRIDGLVPGLKYHLYLETGDRIAPVATDLKVGPGETKDLGEVRTRSPE